MSLDILKCKKVSPHEANATYSVEDNPALQRIQGTGFVCVKENRIGRNCMNNDWHVKYQKLWQSEYDTAEKHKDTKLRENQMVIILPEEFDFKLYPYLDVLEEGSFFNKEELKDFAFLYISW